MATVLSPRRRAVVVVVALTTLLLGACAAAVFALFRPTASQDVPVDVVDLVRDPAPACAASTSCSA